MAWVGKFGFILLLGGLMTACLQKPPAELVVMTGDGIAPGGSARSRVAVNIPTVSAPEYLDTYDVLIRTSEFSLKAAPNAKWAEKPSAALTRLIRARAAAAGFATVDRADYDVLVDVDRFEPTSGGTVVLSARWRVVDANDRETVVARGGDTIYQPVAQGPNGNIAAMEVAGQELARRVVSSIPRRARRSS
ncbi:membrane integrity-associated transporter subunit PqiC [Kaustia mangrovi]|uniref:Membrane integrity-associated transporter subunit PqiC n=1 Tax=Kaustia mangrovi TaxID=2593653 RepID=A0A7S8C5K2_9HYPH|nr:PqiC family protein [Kaustia mangrovi]QPC43795.1 membrane integrity-associated transporter subunit PqiC [Kaustia mangrovi]